MAADLREGKTDVSNENFSSRTANINSKRSLKIFYAVGSGDVVGSFRHWKKGEEDPNELALTYASQFFSLAQEALVIGAHPRHDRDQQGEITVEHVPLPTKKGVSYLFHAWKHGLQLMRRARRYGATVCLLTDVIPWGIWALIPKFGIPTILSFHQAPLNPFHTPSRGQKLLHFFAKRLFTKSILIAQQGRSAEQLTPYSPTPFLPTYIPSRFKKREPQPKTVLYCGRLEADKGAAALPTIAHHVWQEDPNWTFHIAGTGSLSPFTDPRFHYHGHLKWPKLTELLATATCVIVPTTTTFREGYNKVVVEALLASTPVITSPVCIPEEHIGAAVTTVPPEDWPAFAQAILNQPSASKTLFPQFYDPKNSWQSALQKALEKCSSKPEFF